MFAALAQMGGTALRSASLARATLHLIRKVAAYNPGRRVGLTPAVRPDSAC